MQLDENWLKQWASKEEIDLAYDLLDDGDIYLTELNYVGQTQSGGTTYEVGAKFYFDESGLLDTWFNLDMLGPQNVRYRSFYTPYNVEKNVFLVAVFLGNMEEFKKLTFSYTSYQLQAMIQDQHSVMGNQQKATLYPLVSVEQDQLFLRFRISMNGKFYIIKSLKQFIYNFVEEATTDYGKYIAFTHRQENLEEAAIPCYKMIQRFVTENHYLFSQGLKDTGIPLKGGYVDDMFEIGLKHTIFSKFTTIMEMTFHDYMPKIVVNLVKETEHVIKISADLPKVISGIDYFYTYDEANMYRLPIKGFEKVRDFLYLLASELGELYVSVEDFPYFMGTIYPQIQNQFEFKSEQMNLDELVPQVVKWSFYFDLEPYEDKDSITCKVIADNGDKTWNFLAEDGEVYDKKVKMQVEYLLLNSFDDILEEENKAIRFILQNEELFDFMEQDLPKFMEIGEVFIEDRLKRVRIRHHIPVKIGISLQSNLLDIDIEVDDIERKELMDILNSYRKHQRFHRLKNGQIVSLENNDSIEMLDEIAQTLNLKELGEKAIQVPAYRSLYLDRLLSEKEEVTYNRDQHYRSLLRDFKTVDESDYTLPSALENVLRPYQKHGYQWLKTLDHYGFGGILADEMGLGKTLQMIAFLLNYYENNENSKPSIIVCPASLVYNWESEFKKFAPNLEIKTVAGTAKIRKEIIHSIKNNEILITSYDLLKRDIQLYLGYQFAYEVLDEAQYIKNSSTLQSKAVKTIDAAMRFALTGTPIENRLSELWSIFDFLMPGLLYKYDAFRNMYEKSIIKDQDEKVMAKLKRVVGPFILRRLKKDVLKDLPEKIEKEAVAQMDKEQEKCYKAYALDVKNRLASQDETSFNKNKMQILADLVRLRQLCCDPSLVYEDYKGGSAKLDLCLELVENGMDSGHKMLIFSQFTSMLDILENKFKEKGIPYYVIKGSTDKKKRLEYVEAFNHDTTPVFLISLKAGGTGLNLTGADMVIHYDPWWNVAVQNQATDRAHRMGQKNNVVVYQLTCKNTIEQRIVQLQKQKQALVQEVLSGDSVKLSSLSKEDLLEILG